MQDIPRRAPLDYGGADLREQDVRDALEARFEVRFGGDGRGRLGRRRRGGGRTGIGVRFRRGLRPGGRLRFRRGARVGIRVRRGYRLRSSFPRRVRLRTGGRRSAGGLSASPAKIRARRRGADSAQ